MSFLLKVNHELSMMGQDVMLALKRVLTLTYQICGVLLHVLNATYVLCPHIVYDVHSAYF